MPGLAGLAACALASVLAAGCGTRVEDRTEPYQPYVPPLNEQLFAADVTPESTSRVIRDVLLEMDGTSTPMTNTSGARWELTAPVRPCRAIIPYRFVVHSGPAADPKEPAQIEVFPEIGAFTRRITGAPIACRKVPSENGPALTVDTTEDAVDAVPGDGFCSTTKDPDAPDSRCSLRAAVMEANHRRGLDVISLEARRYRLTLEGKESDDTPNETVGDLDITESVSIESIGARGGGCADNIGTFLNPDDDFSDRGGTGNGVARIDGGGIDRVFDVYSAPEPSRTEVYLSCLHVFGGRVIAEVAGPLRRFGGGVMNRGDLVMDHVALTSNRMDGLTAGVGIGNLGRLMVRESALLSNAGSVDGAAFGGTDGGGIYNGEGATVTIERSVIALNTAARGPAIENDSGGTLTLVNATVTDNAGSDSSGSLAASIFSRGTANIAWSTLRARDRTLSSAGSGEMNLANSLVVTTSGAGSACPSLGGSVTTIAVRTTDESCIPARWRDRANNIVQPRFLIGLSAGFLVMRGGFTPVLPIRHPRPDESAEGFPMDTAFTLTGCPPTDQRGSPRPVDSIAACDPGAMELQPDDV